VGSCAPHKPLAWDSFWQTVPFFQKGWKSCLQHYLFLSFQRKKNLSSLKERKVGHKAPLFYDN